MPSLYLTVPHHLDIMMLENSIVLQAASVVSRLDNGLIIHICRDLTDLSLLWQN